MKRSNKQNRAIHLLFRLIAETLNEGGFDMRKTLKPEIDIPWTEQTVKEFLWRPIQKAMYAKKSTTELETEEIDKIYDVICRHLGEKIQIEMPPFPSIEELFNPRNDFRNNKNPTNKKIPN